MSALTNTVNIAPAGYVWRKGKGGDLWHIRKPDTNVALCGYEPTNNTKGYKRKLNFYRAGWWLPKKDDGELPMYGVACRGCVAKVAK